MKSYHQTANHVMIHNEWQTNCLFSSTLFVQLQHIDTKSFCPCTISKNEDSRSFVFVTFFLQSICEHISFQVITCNGIKIQNFAKILSYIGHCGIDLLVLSRTECWETG